jgi:hypothetical protein
MLRRNAVTVNKRTAVGTLKSGKKARSPGDGRGGGTGHDRRRQGARRPDLALALRWIPRTALSPRLLAEGGAVARCQKTDKRCPLSGLNCPRGPGQEREGGSNS